MRILKKLTCIFILTLLPAVTHAADRRSERSHWSLEVKGGLFYPAIDSWQAYYGDRKTGHYAASLAYKIFRQLDVGRGLRRSILPMPAVRFMRAR
jgi:hypothetical protein